MKTVKHKHLEGSSELLRATDSKIVKPWSMCEFKPLSQQGPKLNKSPPQKEKKGFGDLDLGLTLKSHEPPPPHPTHNF